MKEKVETILEDLVDPLMPEPENLRPAVRRPFGKQPRKQAQEKDE